MEHSMVTFIIINLMRKGHELATAEWEGPSSICDSVAGFSAAFSCIVGQLTTGQEAACILGRLRQGNNCVFDHAVRLRTLVAESHWIDRALADAFCRIFLKELKTGLLISIFHRVLRPWW